MLPSQKLTLLRQEVEKIDKMLITQLIKRFQKTAKIQQLKKQLGLPLTQKKREQALLQKHFSRARKGKLQGSLIKRLFNLIFSYSKKTGIMK
ncbi:MAG: chorismate mutase [Patescibacteria group bacterium]